MRSLLLILAVLAAAPAVAGPVDDARAAARSGDLDRALELLEEVPDAGERTVLHADFLRASGELDDAVRMLRRAAERRDAPSAVRAAYGAYLVEQAMWEEAVDVLEPAVEGVETVDPAARFWRAMAFDGLGRHSRAELELEDLVRLYNRGEADSAHALLYVALASHRLERFGDANTAFREALDTDPRSVDIRLAWARLFLEKYRPDEAQTLLDEALELAPSDPALLAMRASAELDLTYDVDEAARLAERALEADPFRAEALEVLAALRIDDRDYPGAVALLERVLDTWPRRAESIAMLGAVAWLRDDHEAYAEFEERATELNRRPAAFYHRVGEFAERNFRYEEALALYQTAIETDAGFWPAYISLGIAHSRAGDDGRALQFLRRAFDADPFNARAFNMVELWETTLTDYRYLDDEEIAGLRYRFHRAELTVLARYVPDAVRSAYRTYVERYGVEPEPPVSIEVFADQATFGIRSVGLPMAPQHGICFGHVVTSRSPREGNFNWRQVIEHELSHVFSLQVSNYRVPRWFTEGLAEYDTILSREEWRREHDLALVQALQRDELLGVLDLNRAFVSTERPTQIVEAYFQASLVVEFIAVTWGYDSLVAMLEGWARGQSTTEVVLDVLGVSIEDLDDRFEDALRQRYAAMLPMLEPALWWFSDYDARVAAADDEPQDPRLQAERAWAEVAAGNRSAARDALDAALALDSREPLALLLDGHLAFNARNFTRAEEAYRAAVDAGTESYTALAALGTMAHQRGELDAAVATLERAAELYPREPDLWRRLATIHGERGDARAELEALTAVVMLDEHDGETAREVARRLLAQERYLDGLAFAEMAANIDPFHVDLHPVYGRLAHANGRWDVAARELEFALEGGPSEPDALRRLLAESYDALGRSEEAEALRRQIQ